VILGRIERLSGDHRRLWSAARVWAAHQAPYMASALLALDPVVVDQSEDPPDGRSDLASFPVDQQWHVYLDPDVLHVTDVPTAGFWLIHQVSHLLRHHAERCPAGEGGPGAPVARRTETQQTWNVAADCEINDDLVAGEVAKPSGAVSPAALGFPDSLTAEEYWGLLGGRRGEPRRDPAGDESRCDGDCGSGCDGCRRSWDSGTPGISNTASRLVERDVARRIKEHQRRRGDVPAGWQRWADEVLEPTVSWQRLLASAIRLGVADVAGRVDFSYRKPSRRSSVMTDVILPSLRQPLPKVAMVLDTSGSMSDHMLSQCLAEVQGVLGGLGVGRRHLRVVCCDATAFEAQRVLQARDVQLLGGGGTDMAAGLAKAVELRPRPDLIIVLTDGFTPWPREAPKGIKVIVGLMDPNGAVPDWARTIAIGPSVAA
jgi:predicted metal-dependent peptidase